MTILGCSQIYTFPTAGYGSLQKLAFIIIYNVCFQIHTCTTIVLRPGNFLACLSVLWIHTYGFCGFVFLKQSLLVAQEGLKKLSCLSLHSSTSASDVLMCLLRKIVREKRNLKGSWGLCITITTDFLLPTAKTMIFRVGRRLVQVCTTLPWRPHPFRPGLASVLPVLLHSKWLGPQTATGIMRDHYKAWD